MTEETTEDEYSVPHSATIEERVALVERWSRNHASSISKIADIVSKELMPRVDVIEKWQMERLVAEAREQERDKSLYERLDRIDANINSMRGVWTRIMWIAAGTVVPAIVVGVAVLIVFGGNFVFGLNK